MTDILIILMVIATAALGVLTYIKFRRATGGSVDQDKVSKKKSPPLPRELQELQIEGPQENILDHPGEPKGTQRDQLKPPNRSSV